MFGNASRGDRQIIPIFYQISMFFLHYARNTASITSYITHIKPFYNIRLMVRAPPIFGMRTPYFSTRTPSHRVSYQSWIEDPLLAVHHVVSSGHGQGKELRVRSISLMYAFLQDITLFTVGIFRFMI